LQNRYAARFATALYCSADPRIYRPRLARKLYDLGYLGTFSADRQSALERLLLEPARRASERRFVVAGSLYPRDIAWPSNVRRIEHLAPGEHAAFYNACRFALNVTRKDMVRAGFSPSVRLFEAAACATPVISDRWPGLEETFQPGREILVPDSTEDVLAILADMSDRQAQAVGRAARRRFLAEHSSDRRAAEFEARLREAEAARRRSTAMSHRKIPNQQAVRAFG
jgi:spore maturation protein CgeB